MGGFWGPKGRVRVEGRMPDKPPGNVDERPMQCCMCDRKVMVWSSTTRHPEAPELIQLPKGAWLGWMQGDHAPEMTVVCSDECRLELLKEGGR